MTNLKQQVKKGAKHGAALGGAIGATEGIAASMKTAKAFGNRASLKTKLLGGAIATGYQAGKRALQGSIAGATGRAIGYQAAKAIKKPKQFNTYSALIEFSEVINEFGRGKDKKQRTRKKLTLKGHAIKGALTGAALGGVQGAALGSAIPGVGTAVGGTLGAVEGGIKGGILGTATYGIRRRLREGASKK